MELSSIVLSGLYRGIIVIGDIHNQVNHLKQAVEFAEENGLFIVLLGDLFDGGQYPYEVSQLVCGLLRDDKAVFTIGNHDDKIYRYSLGNKVKLNHDQLDTFLRVGDENMSKFLDNVSFIVNHKNSGLCHRFSDQAIFVHAAVHQSLWENDVMHSAAKAMCLYGEVDGTRDERGFPIRTYQWINFVPSGKYVVVGHDRTALGKTHTMPAMLCTNQGGRVIFADSSCGKEQDGPLTGVVFTMDKLNLIFNSFRLFAGCNDEAVSRSIE